MVYQMYMFLPWTNNFVNMKRLLLIIGMLLFSVFVKAQSSNLPLIEIGELSTTHVLFTTDLTYVDISRQDVIVAKVVDASKNMLALKAKGEFGFVTTISALEANGTMHTFRVKYNPFPDNLVFDTRVSADQQPSATSSSTVNTQVRPVNDFNADNAGSIAAQTKPEVRQTASPTNGVIVTTSETSNFGKIDAPTLEEIMKLPQKIFHIGDKNFKIEAYCTNIYVYSDLIYLVLTVYNNSDIGYEAGDAQFAIESVSSKKKNISSDKDVWAKSMYGNLSCPPQGVSHVGYTIPKFTLLKDECLKVYIYEKKGTRNLILTLYDEDINYAVSPK